MKTTRQQNSSSPGWWRLALGAVIVAAFTTALRAEAPGDDSSQAEKTEENLKSLQDPTILARRAWADTEWNQYADGRHYLEETLGGLWAWRVSEAQDWGVRVTVPYEWHLAGDAAGYSDDRGLGDIKFATGTAFHLGRTWRMGLGAELRTPTAEAGLGDNVWRIQEFVALAWDATPWLTLSPSAEYNQSFHEEPGVASQHFLEMYFPATFLLPHHWSVSPRYEAKVNFEDDNYVTHTAKFLIAKQLTNPPLGLAASVKRSFDSGEKDFTVNFIVTYYFR